MKIQRMFKYSISFFILLFSSSLIFSQEAKSSNDTIVYKQKYGLRIGADLSRIARSFLDEDYENGFEIVADYRINKRFFIAAEIGNEQNTTDEEFFNFTTNGSYFKLGFDYNTYENWLGAQDAIFIGMRYGVSTFSQTINSFTINNRNQFFNEGDVLGTSEELLQEFSGLSAQWVEAVVGIKAELFSNLFLSLSFRINFLVSDEASDIFPNLWAPGFNRISENSNVGVGYNYTLTYLIPIFKK